MIHCQSPILFVSKAAWENLNGEVARSSRLRQDREPIDFFDPVIRNWNAADGCAVTVQEDVSARILM